MKSALKSIIAATLLGITALAGRTESLDTRVRAELNQGAKDDQKYTLCFGNTDLTAKTYVHQGDSGDFTSLAGQSKLGTAFTSFGDKKGIGAELPINYRNATLTVNAEQLEATPKDSTRLGAAFNYKLGKATLGVAQDQIETAGTNRIQNLVNIVYDQKTDQFGAAFLAKEEARSADAFWCHYGKDEAWGTRTYGKYDWNNQNSDNCITLDSITAQNPTFSSVSSPWIVDRGSTGAGMYNQGLVENPFASERVPLNNRSKKGAVTEIKYTASEKSEVLDRTLRLDAGYTFPQVGKFKPGVLAIYSHNADTHAKDFAGASAIATYSASSASVCLEATQTRNLESDKAETYVSLSFAKKF